MNTAGKVLGRLDRSHTRRTSKKTTEKVGKTAERGMEAIRRLSSRLQFTDEERATPELQKTIRKSDKATGKLDVVQENIPKRKKLVRKRAFDEAAGTSKTRLYFKEAGRLFTDRIWHTPLSRPVQKVGRKLHEETREVKKEGVNVEGGHTAERLGEKTVGREYRLVKNDIHHHKLKPYRAAAKAEQSAIKANANFLYQKALQSNPQLVAGNPLPRSLQKRHIKWSYAKQIRDTEKTVKNADGVVKSAIIETKEAVEKTVKSIIRN